MALLFIKIVLVVLTLQIVWAKNNFTEFTSDTLYAYNEEAQPKFFFFPFLGQQQPNTMRPIIIAPAPTPAPLPTPFPLFPTPAPTPVTVFVTPSPPFGTCTTTFQSVTVTGTCSSSCGTGTVSTTTCNSGNPSSSVGICCVAAFNSCGQSSNSLRAYFVNQAYPSSHVPQTPCSFTIQKASSDVCLVRIDYNNVVLTGDRPGCLVATDQLTIPNVIANGGAKENFITCGTLSNSYAIVEFGQNNAIPITIKPAGANDNRVWNIKITQIQNTCNAGQ